MINNNKGALGVLLFILAVIIIVGAVFFVVTLLGYDSDDTDGEDLPITLVDAGEGNDTYQEPEVNHISDISGSFSSGADDEETTARWGELIDVNLDADPANGDIVYENIVGHCIDEDEQIVINVVSSHAHYELRVVGNDLLIYNFDSNPGTETVTLDCNGEEAEFDLTVCHEVALGFGSTILC